MKKIVYLLTLALWALTPVTALDLNENLLETKLSNGLKVIIRPVDVPLVHVRIIYNVGFRDSPPEALEMPHYLEHMLFRETQDYKDGEIVRLVAETGGWQNGYTSLDHTVYLQTVSVAYLDQILSMEASRMDRTLFRGRTLALERDIVASELRNSKSSTTQDFNRRIIETLKLPYTPLLDLDKRISQLSSITSDSMEAWYKQYYRPDNATLIIVGNVVPLEALEKIKSHFGTKTSQGPLTVRTPSKPPEIEGKNRIQEKGVVTQPFGSRFFNGFTFNENERRQLIWEFITQSGFLPEMELWQGSDYGYIVQNYNEIAPQPLEVIDWDILKERFPTVLKQFLSYRTGGYDDIDALANTLAYYANFHGSPSYEIQKYQGWSSLKWEEVEAELKKTLDTDITLTTHFAMMSAPPQGSPNTSGTQLGVQMSDNFSQKVDYSFLEKNDEKEISRFELLLKTLAPQMEQYLNTQIKKWEKTVLSNGLEVYYQKVGLTGKTRATLFLRSGTRFESKPFLAEYTGRLLLEGGPQILQRIQLEKNGGNWSTSSGGNEWLWQSVESQSSDTEMLLNILSDTVVDRRFNPWLLDARKESLTLWKKGQENNRDPWYWSWQLLQNNLYGSKDPKALRLTAQEGNILATTLKDVEEFYTLHYTPQGSRLFVTSNLELKSILPYIENGLGKWQENDEKPVEPEATSINPAQGKQWVQTLTNAPESVIRFQYPILEKLTPKEKTALELGYAILGGSMDSRIFREIRGRKAMGYGVNAYLANLDDNEAKAHMGYLLIQSNQVNQGIEAFESEVQRFVVDGPTEMELVYAKNKVINSFAFKFKNQTEYHNLMIYRAISKNWDNYDEVQRLLSITRADIVEVFQKTLNPLQYDISIAGNYKK